MYPLKSTNNNIYKQKLYFIPTILIYNLTYMYIYLKLKQTQ